jgi:hypothetical protein
MFCVTNKGGGWKQLIIEDYSVMDFGGVEPSVSNNEKAVTSGTTAAHNKHRVRSDIQHSPPKFESKSEEFPFS